jgi:HlyD family secretion protein
MTRLLSLALLVGIAAGGTALYSKFFRSDSDQPPFRVEKVIRGDMQINVRATGTVEPEETVDVGAQVVGRIKQLGKDPRGMADPDYANKSVDYGTPVSKGTVLATVESQVVLAAASDKTAGTSGERSHKKLESDSLGTTKSEPAEKSSATATKTKAHVATGTDINYDPAFENKSVDYGSPVQKGIVLAQIDPAVYKAQFDQATAALAQANARVLQAQAVVAQTAAEWERAQRLRDIKLPSRSPTGSANSTQSLPIKGISEAEYVLAQANAESAKADLEAARAAVMQQTATLALAKTNLDYTTIISPIDGTIIDRRVNIGQTVVSSLNAPSLFLIARDLRRMQVWAAVNEADIAKVKPGTQVHFRVDALPQDTFRGTVIQRRLNASMTQNVVTYTVVIGVDNSDLKLLPYLTADVYFEVDSRKDALIVPNAALRFKPTPDQIDSEWLAQNPETKAAPSARSGRRERKDTAAPSTGRLWVVVPGTDKLRPIDVQTGVSDLITSLTEITGGDVHEGDEIVLGESRPQAAASSSDVTNPLAPPRFRGNRSQSKNSS